MHGLMGDSSGSPSLSPRFLRSFVLASISPIMAALPFWRLVCSICYPQPSDAPGVASIEVAAAPPLFLSRRRRRNCSGALGVRGFGVPDRFPFITPMFRNSAAAPVRFPDPDDERRVWSNAPGGGGMAAWCAAAVGQWAQPMSPSPEARCGGPKFAVVGFLLANALRVASKDIRRLGRYGQHAPTAPACKGAARKPAYLMLTRSSGSIANCEWPVPRGAEVHLKTASRMT